MPIVRSGNETSVSGGSVQLEPTLADVAEAVEDLAEAVGEAVERTGPKRAPQAAPAAVFRDVSESAGA
jgi:hypothetical protein